MENIVKAKAKKRGVKPGTKRGPYKRLETSKIDQLTNQLCEAIQEKIKYLEQLLKGLK